MKPAAPFNFWTMNPDQFILKHGLKEVVSQMIFEPSSNNFHPEGLFSEEIFGQLGSASRISTLGYINLNTDILAPVIYKNVIDLKPVYASIMQGKTAAVWNEKTKQFDVCTKDFEGADTGYSFFISHFNDLVFEKTSSPTRNNKILTINKAKASKTAIVNKLIVSPAGIRDVKEERGKIAVEEVNKLYKTVLAISQEVKNSLNNPFMAKFYDGIKYNLQLKIYEIYAYWSNFLDGKTGFAQRRYARRAIAYGTRNVVTSAEMTGTSPSDPTFLKHNETLLPIFQAAKAFQPLVIHAIREYFFNAIFTFGSVNIPVIDPETKKLVYTEIKDSELTKALSTELAEELISMFQNTETRLNPVSIQDKNDKTYWLYLIYDTGDTIQIFRNMDEFIERYKRYNPNKELIMDNIRPLTYLEMMYLATEHATRGKYATVTRYPAIEIGSIYPSLVKIGSTVPSREIIYKFDPYEIKLPHYPVLGNAYLDSTVFHPSQAAGLGADYDKQSHCRSKIGELSEKV